MSGAYVPVVSMKAANISVQQLRTSLRTGQYISLATYHATVQSEQINPLASIHYPYTQSVTPTDASPHHGGLGGVF